MRYMFAQSILGVIGITIFSCTNSIDRTHLNNDKIKKGHSQQDSLRECILEKDTLLDEKNSIKYIVVDSFYTLKVLVGGIDTILPYQFNCSVPRNLVPSFHSFYKNTICLIRGAGRNYRMFTIFYTDNNRIVANEYETALITDLKDDLVVYQKYDSPEIITIEHIRTKLRSTVTIPPTFLSNSNSILSATIEKQKLTLKFSDKREIHFSHIN